MKFTTINRPSKAVLRILSHKMTDAELKEMVLSGTVEAVGICQGTVLEVMIAGDIAEKTADVMAGELVGNCPQHITCLAILGSTSAVTAAVKAVRDGIADYQL